MKIRIKGNSIRFRLSKTEVQELCSNGSVWSNTHFGEEASNLRYGLQVSQTIQEMNASFQKNTICIEIPQALIKDWENNDLVGFENVQKTETNDGLSLLIEKDFQCTIERPNENEEDLYNNPNVKE